MKDSMRGLSGWRDLEEAGTAKAFPHQISSPQAAG